MTKITGEMFPDQFPPSMPYQQVTHFSTNPPQLSLSFFNNVSANLTYSEEGSFTKFTVDEKTCTLSDYLGDNGEVNAFFNKLCSFFGNGGNYYYDIANNGNEKTLTISNAIFQTIYFKAENLSTIGNELAQIVLSPNPVKTNLNITYPKGISSASLFDSSGKLMYEQKKEHEKILKIDMQNFKSGIYFIQINGEVSHKIIKE